MTAKCRTVVEFDMEMEFSVFQSNGKELVRSKLMPYFYAKLQNASPLQMHRLRKWRISFQLNLVPVLVVIFQSTTFFLIVSLSTPSTNETQQQNSNIGRQANRLVIRFIVAASSAINRNAMSKGDSLFHVTLLLVLFQLHVCCQPSITL